MAPKGAIAPSKFSNKDLTYSLRCYSGHVPVWLSGSHCIPEDAKVSLARVGALCFGVLPLVLEWKILAIDRNFYRPHFWAHFSFTERPRLCGEFFLEPSSLGAAL